MTKQITQLSSEITAGAGFCFGLQEIQSILGIIMTAVSLIILIINFALRTYDRIKGADKNGDGKIDAEEIKQVANEVINDAKEIKSDIEDKLNK